ncbi:MAG: GxxExxY protein [Candidatus Methylacidiphilales bacterium]|nr:GxxExxY protein [Candidatus Methylacidiphilales bacterium]
MIAKMKDIEEIGGQVLDAALAVHRELGPGLLESTYEACLLHEFSSRGIHARAQVALPVAYKGLELDAGYRIDILVEGQIIVELKSVEQLLPVHQAQMISYLKLSGLSLGFLINFNVPLLKQGFKRVVLGASDIKNTSRASRPSR